VGSWGIPPGEGVIANLPLNYRLYYQAIEQKIKNNWNLALPRGIIEDMRGMEVVISITIRSDGEITDISFEEKTGNVYLDDSAYRSVKKSSPLPPFSEYNIREPFFETGIVFPAGELL
ncbi:MAG: TonB C-terminal domain-containing protein, partial [Deltaproteobacteria bacterium]|nr:TonB C-terminal domain-containing protein [Deltaproteobacteria bacterium]